MKRIKDGHSIQWSNEKVKGQTMNHKTLHRKLVIEKHESH
jgi:hypothetical protein